MIQATGRSKDYRADVGFTRRTDINQIAVRGLGEPNQNLRRELSVPNSSSRGGGYRELWEEKLDSFEQY
ncbi:MAG: hypothetical protein HKN25_16475 [Pyrinomonadaceae bacterium]|nr:hypothetical protein [Pyrinomonadaceae bacterium]